MWVCVVIGVVGIGGLAWKSWVLVADGNGRYITNSTAGGVEQDNTGNSTNSTFYNETYVINNTNNTDHRANNNQTPP